MPLTLWEKDGKLISNGDESALLECEDCPCDEEVECAHCPDSPLPTTAILDVGTRTFDSTVCAACSTTIAGEIEIEAGEPGDFGTNDELDICVYGRCDPLCEVAPRKWSFRAVLTIGLSGAMRRYTATIQSLWSTAEYCAILNFGEEWIYQLDVPLADVCQGTFTLNHISTTNGATPGCRDTSPPATITLTL